MRFVTLEQAKLRLRFDTDHEDDDLSLIIAGASRACWQYIKDGVEDGGWTDSAGLPVEDSAGYTLNVPEDIQNAVLVLVGYLSKEREGDNTAEIEHGFLPVAVRMMLYPYRLPTLA